MKHLTIPLLALVSIVSAKPTFLPVPLYATLTPGGPIPANDKTLDGTEVARAQHLLDDRVNPAANEGPHQHLQTLRPRKPSSLVHNGGLLTLTSPAPLGADGRVVDTAEVAAAKAAHAAAHVNERLNLANEAARSGGTSESSEVADNSSSNPDDGSLGTSEVAHEYERGNLVNEVGRSGDTLTRIADGRGTLVPLVLADGIVALVQVDPHGGLPASPEAPGNRNPVNDAKTVDALAIAGPALAYGRLVY